MPNIDFESFCVKEGSSIQGDRDHKMDRGACTHISSFFAKEPHFFCKTDAQQLVSLFDRTIQNFMALPSGTKISLKEYEKMSLVNLP